MPGLVSVYYTWPGMDQAYFYSRGAYTQKLSNHSNYTSNKSNEINSGLQTPQMLSSHGNCTASSQSHKPWHQYIQYEYITLHLYTDESSNGTIPPHHYQFQKSYGQSANTCSVKFYSTTSTSYQHYLHTYTGLLFQWHDNNQQLLDAPCN